jgi:hypothetical protein
LAERLHQSVGARIEPKLPMFECEGAVTEPDGSSGVVIMRTLESYLAPHRHTQDHHCYIRRNDRAEPMSMLEIQELVRRKARGAEEAEHAFGESAERFFAWIPTQHQRTDPDKSLQVVLRRDPGSDAKWTLMWAMRFTARPLGPFAIDNLPKQRWLSNIKVDTYQGSGELGTLLWHDMRPLRRGSRDYGLSNVSLSGMRASVSIE